MRLINQRMEKNSKAEEDERQKREPFLEACIAYMNSDPAPFDVPGHKMGHWTDDLVQYAGDKVFQSDFNAPIGLDNLYNPHGVIKEAEELAAEAFHAEHAIFSVNGTTGGIITMMTALIPAKGKIILPRNVHKSVINGLIISGSYPVFVMPDTDKETGIANGVAFEDYKKAIDENPDAKAVFVINPTYFGIVSDLKKIVRYAHAKGMIVMTDEAHGAHFVFSKEMPCSAMDAGADVSTLSVHKTAGSLTQTSLILLQGRRVDYLRVFKVFSMFSSTSPNHVLIASLDAARKAMYFDGAGLIHNSVVLAKKAAEAINALPGLSVLDDSYLNMKGRFGRDPSKVVINVSGLGITGFKVYHTLREKFNIQLELAEVSEVLAIFGLGTTERDTKRLIAGFTWLSKEYYGKKEKLKIPHFDYHYPRLLVRPRDAFNAPAKVVKMKDSLGEISAEAIMIYPPGIPVIIPGEVISQNTIDLLNFYKKNQGVLLSDSPEGMIKVVDQSKWYMTEDLHLND